MLVSIWDYSYKFIVIIISVALKGIAKLHTHTHAHSHTFALIYGYILCQTKGYVLLMAYLVMTVGLNGVKHPPVSCSGPQQPKSQQTLAGPLALIDGHTFGCGVFILIPNEAKWPTKLKP